MKWNQLTNTNQLDALVQDSYKRSQIIFKHSTRCIISKMVLSDFEKKFDQSSQQADLHFLDLIQFREISNQIALALKVRHESPQIILLRNGAVMHHESHDSITAPLVETWISENN